MAFFRRTKCKLSRVPNTPNYCSSYKTLSSLKLFLDLAWMLQPNDSWVQPVLTALSGPAGRNCDRRREIGTGKGTNSIVCVLGGWELSFFFLFFFPHSFTWIQLEVPKWNRSMETSDFSPIFLLLFQVENDPVCRVPTSQYPEQLPTCSIFPKECLTIPGAHKNSPEDPFQPWSPRGGEWAWTVIGEERFKRHLGQNRNKKGNIRQKICSRGSRRADSKLWIPRAMINPWRYCCLTSYQSFLSPTESWVPSKGWISCGWTLCFTPSVKP